MKRGLLITLGIGIGWVLGVTLAMVLIPFNFGEVEFHFGETMGNLFVFGFPGFVLMMIAFILSLRDDVFDPYGGKF